MLVYVRGAGDIATGVAARLVRAGRFGRYGRYRGSHVHPPHNLFLRGHSPGRGRGRRHSRSLARTPAEALEITELETSLLWWTLSQDARRAETRGCGRRDFG